MSISRRQTQLAEGEVFQRLSQRYQVTLGWATKLEQIWMQQNVTNLNATMSMHQEKLFNLSQRYQAGYPPAGQQSLTKCNKYECNMSLAAGEAFHRLLRQQSLGNKDWRSKVEDARFKWFKWDGGGGEGWGVSGHIYMAKIWDFLNKHCQKHNGPRNWLRDLD